MLILFKKNSSCYLGDIQKGCLSGCQPTQFLQYKTTRYLAFGYQVCIFFIDLIILPQ